MPAILSQRVPVVEPDGTPTAYLMRVFQTVATLPAGLSIEATNDTTLTFRLRGADGVVRSATLTLA